MKLGRKQLFCVVLFLVLVPVVIGLSAWRIAIAGFQGPETSVPEYLEPILPVSYVIDTNGTHFFMYNGTTWKRDWSSTDASAVFKACMGNLSYGGKVFVRAGKYRISSTITPLTPYFQLVGEGVESTILRLDNGVNDNVIFSNDTHQYLVIRDLTIDGNRAGQTGSGSITGSNGISLMGGWRAHGNSGYRPLIQNVRVTNCYDSGIRLDPSSGTGSAQGVGAQFWNVRCELNGLHGLEIKQYVADTKIFGGVFSGNGLIASPSQGDGIHIEAYTSSVMISNPHCGAERGQYNRYGIYYNGGPATIQGGYIQKSNEHGIYLDTSARRVTVQGVLFVSVGQRATNSYCGIYQTGSQNGFVVTACQFQSSGTKAMNYAVDINGGDYHVVACNTAWGTNQSIAFDVAGANSQVGNNTDWG